MGGGESGIRTHGRLTPTAVFKTAALNHSAISPFFSALQCACMPIANGMMTRAPSYQERCARGPFGFLRDSEYKAQTMIVTGIKPPSSGNSVAG
jgi:hypothetical protein